MVQKSYQEKRLKPIIVILILVGVVVVVISILGISGFFHKNPYGPETKIDNYRSYIKKSPQDTQDATFTALYNAIKINVSDPEAIPSNGAKIRDGSFTSTVEEDNTIHFDTFIVDIDSIQQSYYAQITWSNNKEADLGGYPILFTCPTAEQLIYQEFDCIDLITQNKISDLYKKYPIINQLPLEISYYLGDFGTYVHYQINYEIIDGEDDIKIVIEDYTGGNLDNAKKKLQTLDPQVDKYTIEYIDKSNDQNTIPGRAPNDISW